MGSRLREFPVSLHTARQFLHAEREYGSSIDIWAEVAFECAKAARLTLELARLNRAKHGLMPWKPGARDSELAIDLLNFIAGEIAIHEVPHGSRTPKMAEKALRVEMGATLAEWIATRVGELDRSDYHFSVGRIPFRPVHVHLRLFVWHGHARTRNEGGRCNSRRRLFGRWTRAGRLLYREFLLKRNLAPMQFAKALV